MHAINVDIAKQNDGRLASTTRGGRGGALTGEIRKLAGDMIDPGFTLIPFFIFQRQNLTKVDCLCRANSKRQAEGYQGADSAARSGVEGSTGVPQQERVRPGETNAPGHLPSETNRRRRTLMAGGSRRPRAAATACWRNDVGSRSRPRR